MKKNGGKHKIQKSEVFLDRRRLPGKDSSLDVKETTIPKAP